MIMQQTGMDREGSSHSIFRTINLIYARCTEITRQNVSQNWQDLKQEPLAYVSDTFLLCGLFGPKSEDQLQNIYDNKWDVLLWQWVLSLLWLQLFESVQGTGFSQHTAGVLEGEMTLVNTWMTTPWNLLVN